MCDVISGIGLAASLIGGAMQSDANSQQITARNNAYAQEMQRQQGFQQQAQNTFQQALQSQSQPAQDQQRQKAGASETQAIQSQVGSAYVPNVGVNPTATNAPSQVNDAILRSVQQRLQQGQTQSAALGNLRSYGDNNMANQFGLLHSDQNMGMITNNAQQSANIGRQEEDAAFNNAAPNEAAFGSLLGGGIASGLMHYGARNSGSSAPASSSSSTGSGSGGGMLSWL
jgi:hypothetical protein